MQEEDREAFATCLACGAVIESTADRSFPFGGGNELCNVCAVARGGAYCADRDVWDPPPDLSGLRDDAYEVSRPTRRL